MAELIKGTIVNDRFEVTEHLGTGGFASVWEGYDKQLERKVAIKRLLAEGFRSPTLKKDAIDEARKIASVSHLNIVSIFDVIPHEDEIVIVMEHLNGGSLHDLLRKLSKNGKWFCPVESFDLIQGVLSGLHAAHDAENGPIIHKDLKPLNILFDSRQNPKIADFGLASTGIVDPINTAHPGKWEHEGTLGFKSPEQLRGQRMDIRSDLFNVGLIAYLLFVQFHPFVDPRFLFDYKEMVLDPYRPLPRLNSEKLPPELDSFLFALLSNEPDKRFTNAAEAIADLDHIQGEYEKMLLDHSLLKYDYLKGNLSSDFELSDMEISKGIYLCKRNGVYTQGAFLYEKSGTDFSELSPSQKAELENHYNFCRRRAGKEVSQDGN